MSIEAMKLALEALKLAGGNLCEALHHPKKLQHGIGEPCPAVAKYGAAITALRQAIEQAQKQEPVVNYCRECLTYNGHQEGCSHYTSPPPRQPLTDEEIKAALSDMSALQMPFNKLIPAIARAIEAAHGIKGEA